MIVIAAATEMELEYLKAYYSENKNVKLLVTGAGIVNATFETTRFLLHETNVEIFINIGIVGYAGRDKNIGDCIKVIDETLIDIGMQNEDKFLSAFTFPFFKNESIYNNDGKITWENKEYFNHLPHVSAITSSIVHGNQQSVRWIEENYNSTVESMEGWAVAYVCKALKIPFCVIKGISNYIEPRNKSNWKIDLALKNINKEIKQIF